MTDPVIEVVASGALAARLPAGERPGRARIEMPSGSSVADLLDRLGVPPERAVLVILNGTVIPPDRRDAHVLAHGDALSLAPPIRAG